MTFHPQYSKGIFVNILDPELSGVERAVGFAKSLNGLGHIEIWMECLPKSDGELKTLSQIFAGCTLIVHAPFIHQSLMSHLREVNELSIRLCNRTMQVSEILGARVVTFHGGSYPTHLESDQAFLLLYDNLRQLVENWSGTCAISIENLPERGGATTNYPTTLRDLVRLGNHMPGLQYTFDVGHAVQNGERYKDFIYESSENIADIHLHDAVRGGRGHLALGSGQLNLEDFIGSVMGAQYKGFLTLETLSEEDTARSWELLIETERKVLNLLPA